MKATALISQAKSGPPSTVPEEQHSGSHGTGTSTGHLGAVDLLRAMLGPILIEGKRLVEFEGGIHIDDAVAIWTWLVRDIDPQLPAYAHTMLAGSTARADMREQFTNLIAQLISANHRAREGQADAMRKLEIQLGGPDVLAALPRFQSAMAHHKLIFAMSSLARSMGRAPDAAAIKKAIRGLPLSHEGAGGLAALSFVSGLDNPQTLVEIIAQASGGSDSARVRQAGFGVIIEALIASCQNKLAVFERAASTGTFVDMDGLCQTLERYRRFVRAAHIVIENDRRLDWFQNISLIIREMSAHVEARIRNCDQQIRRTLRPARLGEDVFDGDAVLEALNAMYLLSAARNARDALALNSLLDDSWTATGQSIEMLVSQNLELLRLDPMNKVKAKRSEAAVKLAAIRFGRDYASAFRKSLESIVSRVSAD